MRRKNKGVNITFSLYPARRRPMLAPRIPPSAGPCWRHPAGNPLSHRRDTPTGHPESRSAPAHVGAAPPAKPYPTVGPRQQGDPNPARRLPMLAPPHSNRNLVGATGIKSEK